MEILYCMKVNKIREGLKKLWNESSIKRFIKIYRCCAIAAIVVLLFLQLYYSNTYGRDARYILSAIPQALAAILALVFTITLVAAQMTKRYTAMDKMFKPETKILMLIFGFGIVIPLLMLKFECWRLGVNVSIAIAAFCVFSLYPLLKNVNATLKYDIGIEKLIEEEGEAIDEGHDLTASNRISELGEIGRSACKEIRESDVIKITSALNDAGVKAAEERLKRATVAAINGLGEVGLEAARKKLDAQREREFRSASGVVSLSGRKQFSATASALRALKEVGTKAAEADMEDAIVYAIDYLTGRTGIEAGVGIVAMENGLSRDTINESVLGLKEVGKKSAEKRLTYSGKSFVIVRSVEKLIEFGNKAIEHEYETDLIVNVLWVLGGAATKYSVDFDMGKQVVDQLQLERSKVEIPTIMDLFEEGFDNALRYANGKFPDSVQSLREFKRRYEER